MVKPSVLLLALCLISCSGGGGDALEGQVDREGTIPLSEFTAGDTDINSVGNVGGMIGAASILLKTKLGTVIVWGQGGSLRYGTVNDQLGSTTIGYPGTITTITTIDSGKIFFGTDKGLGLAQFTTGSGGTFEVTKYFKFDGGILSSTIANNGTIYMIDGNGNVLSATIAQIERDKEVNLVRSSKSWSGDKQLFAIAVAAGDKDAAVILQEGKPLPVFAMGYEPIETTLLYMGSGIQNRQIRLVSSDETIQLKQMGSSRTAFSPTGLVFDGDTLIVAGVAFNAARTSTITQLNCSSATDKIACLIDIAVSEILFTSDNKDTDVITGRVIRYNLSSKETVASKEIYVTNFLSLSGQTPPLAFAIAEAGSILYLRATPFLMLLNANSDRTGWDTLHQFVSDKGAVECGFPRSIVADVSGGAVSTIVRPASPTSPAYSALEHISENAQKVLIDSANYDTKYSTTPSQNPLPSKGQPQRTGNHR